MSSQNDQLQTTITQQLSQIQQHKDQYNILKLKLGGLTSLDSCQQVFCVLKKKQVPSLTQEILITLNFCVLALVFIFLATVPEDSKFYNEQFYNSAHRAATCRIRDQHFNYTNYSFLSQTLCENDNL